MRRGCGAGTGSAWSRDGFRAPNSNPVPKERELRGRGWDLHRGIGRKRDSGNKNGEDPEWICGKKLL